MLESTSFDNISNKHLVIGPKKLEYSFSCSLQAREHLAIWNFFVLLLWIVQLYISGKQDYSHTEEVSGQSVH